MTATVAHPDAADPLVSIDGPRSLASRLCLYERAVITNRLPSLPVGRGPGREAVAAIHRLVPARLERHFGRLPALAAGGLEHLAAAAARRSATAAEASATVPGTAAGSALRLTGGAAFGATVRLVLEAFAREELLLSGTENKLAVTINAAQGFICIHG